MHRKLRPGFGTETAVYGTILVSGLVAVSSAHGESSAKVLITVAATVLVFWGAHVFAGTVARVGDRMTDGEEHVYGVRLALRHSARRSLGMLVSSLPPLVVLLLGTTRVIPDEFANECALWVGVVILAILGYIAFVRRGSSIPARVLGTLATASFGLVFIALKAFVH
ncbi:hypothetical protein G7068_09050 [Leucobacter viscericola]|uniref:Uncharacterized protein n=1 Tax=Leucobacter viscericola TaxID=2714935 RepID=A0A6G7XJK1_9MICO|nr:hypothetical protein G7068_09050 [Leucobacter viscericola]